MVAWGGVQAFEQDHGIQPIGLSDAIAVVDTRPSRPDGPAVGDADRSIAEDADGIVP